MRYEFRVYQMQVDEHLFWIAKSTALKGCVGQGETAREAISELEINENEWLITAEECNIPIPTPSIQKENSYSGKISLRFSAFTHEEASENAKVLGVSLNQYINDAIVYYNATIKSKSSMEKPLPTGQSIETTNTTVINFKEFASKNTDTYKIFLDDTNMEEM